MSTGLPSFSFDPSSAAVLPNRSRSIGALWRRFLAFLIDGAILCLVGLVLGFFFFNLFSQLGPWGRLVGFLVSLVYFSVFESSVGGGQSLGKLWLKLIVVDAQGSTIPFDKAVCRSAVFALPWFLNLLPLPVTRTPESVLMFSQVLVFGVGGATLYLLAFNRATRQGLHDLAVGSYVAGATGSGPVDAKRFWNKHWLAVGLLCVFSVAAGVLGSRATNGGTFPELTNDLHFVERVDGVQRGGAYAKTTISGNGERTTDLEITAFFPEEILEPAAQAALIARHILENDPKAESYDSISIVIRRGYDIGIARASVSQSFVRTPVEWNKREPDPTALENPEPAQQ